MAPRFPSSLTIPNRADALGIFKDSLVSQVPSAAYSRSRYAAALERLIARLSTMAGVAQGSNARGKRRKKERPQDQNNTIRTYLKALELWSYYSVATWGRELEPREITIDTAIDYALWMHGDKEGPDVRRYYVSALGPDYVGVYEALSRTCSAYGEATITQVAEALNTDLRARMVSMPSDTREAPLLQLLHKMLGRLIRSFRHIVRMPNANEIRRQEGAFWSDREQDPYTYRYSIVPRSALASGSVVTHLAALSAVWSEMSKPATPDEPALLFNPWKSPYAVWHKRLVAERQNAQASGLRKGLTNPLVRSLLNAALGADVESRRDFLALNLLAYLGLRAEELAGLLRGDLRNVDGVLHVAVLGKGDVVRLLPIFGTIKDAWTLFNGKLEELAQQTSANEDGTRVPTYGAKYAKALMTPEAPLVPSLVRWGCNQRDGDAQVDAREPLDTSGVRAMIDRIVERARVKVVATGEIRPLTDCLPQCKTTPCNHEKRRIHPHAFRHYAATAATTAGVPLMDVREMLGHFSIRTTETYIQISPQKSVAFSAGIYRVMNEQAPLTPEELAAMRPRGQNPLAEPDIIEAEPMTETEVSTRASARTTPLSEPEKTRVVESPFWAYEAGDTMLAFLPGVPANKFSTDVKRMEASAQAAVADAEAMGDNDAYIRAAQALIDARARHLWTTFRIGKISRLPWWAGRANRWEGTQLAPIMSYAQMSPENSEDAHLLEELRALYDQFWNERGPTAAAALIAWLTEFLSVVAVQFNSALRERKNNWISFDTAAPPDPRLVREHYPDAILAWFEDFGGSMYSTGYKSARNRGNVAIAAMDSLPDWFWVADPLTDPNLGLPAAERMELKRWVLALQGTRPSKLRLEQWIEQTAVRLNRWSQEIELATSRGAAGAEQLSLLAEQARDIEKDFTARFPKFGWEGKSIDVRAITANLGTDREETLRNRLRAMLASAGIDTAAPTTSFDAAMGQRAGMSHLLDPALLTFDDTGTIVHDEATRRYWFERYGTDSQCVVRRALRVLWDRRSKSLRSQTHGLIVRHFDLWLSALIPCPAEIEARVRAAGWTPPRTVDDVVKVAKVMWQGLGDHVRVAQGANPLTKIPPEAVESFWNREIEMIESFAADHSPSIVDIQSGAAEEPAIIEKLGAEEDVIAAPPEPLPVQSPPEPEMPSPSVAQAPPLPPAPALRPLSEGSVDEMASDFEINRVAAKIAKMTPEQKEARRKERIQQAETASLELARTAVADRDFGLELRADIFWSLVRSPAKYLLLGSIPDAGAYDLSYLRKYEQALRRFLPRIFWDPIGRRLRFRYKYTEAGWPRAGANLHPLRDFRIERKAAVIAVEFPGTSTFTRNPAKMPWIDGRTWAPRWPGYPMPEPADLEDPFVQQIGWPDGSEHPLEAAIRWEGSMRRYARWKRASYRANAARVPSGWQAGVASKSAEPGVVPLPHPVDFVFAALRSA